MTTREHLGNLRSSGVLLLLGGLAAVGLVGAAGTACSEPTTTTSTGGVLTSSSDSSSAAGTGGTAGASGGTGGSGATGSGGTAGAAGSGGGGGGMMGCISNADCAGNPSGEVCDVPTGLCVPCTPAQDVCPVGQYCTPQNNCEVGCTDDMDCTTSTYCKIQTHQCVGCTIDTHCPFGSICSGDTCYPGCSGIQPCQVGFSCCDAQCYELDKDVLHCGDCSTQCIAPPHSSPVCDIGICTYTCVGVYADCNLDGADGCEQNTLQDGPCLCVPGATEVCYNGAPGTENIGVCIAGIKTCNPDGLSFGPCMGAVLPSPELCNGLDDDCDGSAEASPCTPCVPGTGMCMGDLGMWCKDGLGFVEEQCDPVKLGTTCNPMTGRCEGACSLASLGSSYIGCDYYPTVTANLVNSAMHPFTFTMAVSNTGMATATVTASKAGTQISVTTVPPGSVKLIDLPWDDVLKGPSSSSAVIPMPASARVDGGAYRLQSTVPVTVYQFSPLQYTLGPSIFSYTNDASLLLPTNVWTGTYRVASRQHLSRGNGASGVYAVTAKEDNTTVTVTAGPNTKIKPGITGIGNNGSGTVVMNAGDVIQLVTINGTPQPDLSGSLVKADKPVQVIGGHQCMYIPDNMGYCDHLEESIFPYETLGKTYIVTATLIDPLNLKEQFVRIIATKDNTTLTYNPAQPSAPAMIALAGQYVEVEMTKEDFQITADQPILVAQYMTGQTVGGNAGDPAMALAVGKDQYRKSYLFHAPTNYEANYVNVVAPNGVPVIFDGALLGGFTPIGTTGYSVARALLNNSGNGNHSVSANQGIGITVYGYGQYTSYWYPGGLNLTKLHD